MFGTTRAATKLLVSEESLAQFCERWQIAELALFGSALRDDFDDESDVDFLVTFEDSAEWGLLEHVQMEQELESLVRRDVDLITRSALERSSNWVRRNAIFDSAQVVYSTMETERETA